MSLLKKSPVKSVGFTLFEIIVAIFIMLVGIMGVTSVFSVGMHVRMRAQEILLTQELANMWESWIRFRLEADGLADSLAITDLAVAKGDFYDQPGGTIETSAAEGNLPTLKRNVYQGYRWEVTKVEDHVPQWVAEDGSGDRAWNLRKDGKSIYPSGWTGLSPLKKVELSITRGARSYKFTYYFSGVGMKYNDL